MATRHFLTLLDLTPDELAYLIQRAIKIKTDLKANGPVYTPLPNRTLAMIFEKSSTRTRVSFETGMAQFGGHALFLLTPSLAAASQSKTPLACSLRWWMQS